jgi:hypothetical protein
MWVLVQVSSTAAALAKAKAAVAAARSSAAKGGSSAPRSRWTEEEEVGVVAMVEEEGEALAEVGLAPAATEPVVGGRWARYEHTHTHQFMPFVEAFWQAEISLALARRPAARNDAGDMRGAGGVDTARLREVRAGAVPSTAARRSIWVCKC